MLTAPQRTASATDPGSLSELEFRNSLESVAGESLRTNQFNEVAGADRAHGEKQLAGVETRTAPIISVLPLQRLKQPVFRRRKLSRIGADGLQFYRQGFANIYDKMAPARRDLQVREPQWKPDLLFDRVHRESLELVVPLAEPRIKYGRIRNLYGLVVIG